MEAPDIVTHATAAVGGSVTMGALAKYLIQNWIKKHDERADKTGEALQDLGEKTATALEAIRIELGKISIRLEGLQRSSDATVEYGKTIAVMEVRIADFGRCLNGLGQKVKNLNGG